MIGKFGYHKNCSIIHHIPQGQVADGFPVIVFELKAGVLVDGATYDFTLVMTRKAKYTIDGMVYRVGHAHNPRNVSGNEGDTLDVMDEVFGRKKNTGVTLGDAFGGKLAALRERLVASSR